jgi:sterol desaturase/sphingolipid hydroxylase (fatty acid hydroxylase superfamily)
VHHGINPKYLDRNHGGMFIVWDRMFGTFVEEEERPRYGTVQQLFSWQPLRATVAPFVDVWNKSVAAPRAWQKLYAWVAPPEWTPAGRAEVPDVTARPRFDVRAPTATRRLAVVLFVVSIVTSVLFLFVVVPNASDTLVMAGAVGITVLLAIIGALLDRRAEA